MQRHHRFAIALMFVAAFRTVLVFEFVECLTPDSTSTSVARDTIVNTWVGPPADTTKLPVGTSKVSLTGPSAGGCSRRDAGNSRGGAQKAGPWIDEAAGTWDLTKKASVQGEVSWPMAFYSETVTGETRNITSNGLPVGEITGTFPIASTDPAYAYDRNPNRIATSDVNISLPVAPTAAAAPNCLGKGQIGVLVNGVSLFAPPDEANRDAVAFETQDRCDGHPQQQSVYHYHEIPSCIRDAATGASTVVGYAYDGYPIVVERMRKEISRRMLILISAMAVPHSSLLMARSWRATTTQRPTSSRFHRLLHERIRSDDGTCLHL